MTNEAIFELIQRLLADILEVDPSTITLGSSFDDLEADSLARIELVEALEDELTSEDVQFRIDDEDLDDIKNIRDAVEYIAARLPKDDLTDGNDT